MHMQLLRVQQSHVTGVRSTLGPACLPRLTEVSACAECGGAFRSTDTGPAAPEEALLWQDRAAGACTQSADVSAAV